MDVLGCTSCWRTRLADIFLRVKAIVVEEGFGTEIDWQNQISFSKITETDFLREAGWVILSSGMRETVVRQKFPRISAAFFDWEAAERIVRNKKKCTSQAMQHFGHAGKISAIVHISTHLFENGFEAVRQGIEMIGIEYIIQLPYMGPATSYHFAKNIGLPVAKPDRHLTRIAETVGYSSAQSMCADIAEITGEKIPVIDIVFWRFATLYKDYLSYFSSSL